jgi:hypothetical protein
MLKRLPLYPILFAVFPVLSLTAYNLGEISLDVVLRPLFVALLMSAILFGLAGWVFRDWDRTALAVLVALFLFSLINIFQDVTLEMFPYSGTGRYCPVWNRVGILLYFVSAKPSATQWLNFAIFLLIYPSQKSHGTSFSKHRQIVLCRSV